MNSNYQPNLKIKPSLIKQLRNVEIKRQNLNTEIFNAVVTELFIKYQQLNKFSFTAYTPYFNDGDACLYSINYSYPLINNDEEEDDEQLEWRGNFVKDLSYYFGLLHNDFFEDRFGDHIRITFHREDPLNPIIEDYDHD